MKTSLKIIIGIIITLSFAIGLLIGTIVKRQPVNKNDIAGTIGKISTYRDSKIASTDINLRSELQSNNLMMSQYQNYYSFQYTSINELKTDIEEALIACSSSIDFNETNQKIIQSITDFKNILDKNSKEVFKLVTTLQNFSESNQENLGVLINNASNAIAQINYKEIIVVDFLEAIESFLIKNNYENYPGLISTYDVLLDHQIKRSKTTGNKPMIKYLENKFPNKINPENLNTSIESETAFEVINHGLYY
ncbi:MAG: hypothetical protein KA807_06635 [Prolixibacteraceae bacterium]|nr:hypothetical protein [Prolixibacteraceae bacterium]